MILMIFDVYCTIRKQYIVIFIYIELYIDSANVLICEKELLF